MKAIKRIKSVLVEKIGRTENTVSRWVSNKVQPSLENLLEVTDSLDILLNFS